jgi:hypothetical protein
MLDHPLVRDCATCSRFVLDDRGEVATYPDSDGAGGVLEKPMRHEDAGTRPPCATCPKIEPGMAAEPQPEEHDFAPWFWGVRQLFLEGRALGDFGKPDPLMRGLFAEFDQSERRRQQQELVAMVTMAAARIGAKR